MTLYDNVSSHIDGFLIVREQIVESLQVSLLLPQTQLELVDLVVLLLNGSKLVIQRLL